MLVMHGGSGFRWATGRADLGVLEARSSSSRHRGACGSDVIGVHGNQLDCGLRLRRARARIMQPLRLLLVLSLIHI